MTFPGKTQLVAIFLLLISSAVAIKIGQKNILLVSEKLNWFTAQELCQSRGMELLALNNSNDNCELNKIMEENNFEEIWIGANNLGFRDNFMWSSTGKFVAQASWYGGNPDNFMGMENCVEVNKLGWNDANCMLERKSICAYDPIALEGMFGGCHSLIGDEDEIDCYFYDTNNMETIKEFVRNGEIWQETDENEIE